MSAADDDRLPSHLQQPDGLLIRALDRLQRQVLVDFEACLARVAGEQLKLGIGELLTGQEGKHLVPEQVGMHELTQPGCSPVALHNLLHASHRVRPTALRLKHKAVLGVGGKVGRVARG